MGWWRAAWEWLKTTPDAAVFAAESESDPRPIDQVITAMMGQGGVRAVSRDEALSVSAVLKGRNLICSIATLPLVQRGPDRRVVPSPLLTQLDKDVPNIVTLSQTVEDLVFDGIAWWRVLGFGWDGFPAKVRRLDPATVSLDPPSDRSPAPLPSGQDPRGAVVYVDGEPISADEIIRFDSPNPAILKQGGARAIRRAILLDKAAGNYADDPQPTAFFTPREGADPANDDDIREMLDDWRAARKKRSTAYVPAALQYNPVPAPSPRDLQLVELQQQAALEIANAFGVDPEDLGISTTSRTYANVIDRRRDRINDVLSPYMRAITDRLSMGDVTKRGYIVEFRLDDYLKSNPTERWSVYDKAKNLGAMTVEEIREAEGWAELPADTPEQQSEPVDQPDQEQQEETDQVEQVDASALAAVTFADGPSALTLDAEVVGFTVDPQRRIIEGLALPYGKTASKFGTTFRFDRGSLQWSDPGRIKLLRDHDVRQAIGRAEALTDTAAGLKVRFKVARGPEGDRALELAEDGVLDGMSVGVEFDQTADTVPDPKKKGAVLVRRADLREVSLTAMPAFDDARVSKVAASRDGKDPGMPEQDNEPTQAQTTPPAAGGLTLDADQVTALLSRPGALEALVRQRQTPEKPTTPSGALTLSAEQVDSLIKSGGLGALLGMPQLTQSRPEPEPERRQTVDPTRRTVTASVKEAAPYRFDRGGNLTRGTHDFSTDLIAGSKGDSTALERAQAFMRNQFAAQATAAQFDTDRADVTALNPNRNRPDLYVDQRSYAYPIWDAISKGTIQDSTPFTVPKFNSASGMVANHTEGTEPTAGTYTATSQTITPTPVSGKVEITREAWDQGGNPALSGIIWRQMVKAWNEGLEAAAVSTLDAATPTQITLPAGAVDAALDDALTAAFASLQFIRGGFSMSDMYTQVDLYKALVAATDADGRRLYPAIGPSNATGTARTRYSALDINGVTAWPAWALAATGSTPASSYLFDSESVYGWATSPQRLEFQYRVAYVDLAIWGYKATAILDINGVREVVYDPVA